MASAGVIVIFIVECFAQHQSMCQAWMRVKQKSKRTHCGVPESIKFQVYTFLIEPAEEHVCRAFVELDVSYGMVAADHASNGYGVLD